MLSIDALNAWNLYLMHTEHKQEGRSRKIIMCHSLLVENLNSFGQVGSVPAKER